MNYKIDYNSHISEDLLKYCSLYTAVFSNKKILYKEHYFNFFFLKKWWVESDFKVGSACIVLVGK
jgi:hypothetical protein